MSETGLTQDGRETRRVTLITGASGGIGADLARSLRKTWSRSRARRA